MANITVTHIFSNGTAADATEVNTNFSDVISGTSDGTKDFSINALTVAGTAALNGNVTLGNATGDTITYSGRVASDIDPSAAATYALGSGTLPWTSIFLDNTTTDGGAVYFDAGSTKFIKSDASGADLDISGFTDVDFNSINIKGVANYTGAGTMSHDGAAVFNESGADVDFRIEGDTEVNLFFVDASTDRVGINTATPSTDFHVVGGTSFDGAAVFNESGADVDFRVEGDTATHLIFADASTDNVGINISDPDEKLEVAGTVKASGGFMTYRQTISISDNNGGPTNTDFTSVSIPNNKTAQVTFYSLYNGTHYGVAGITIGAAASTTTAWTSASFSSGTNGGITLGTPTYVFSSNVCYPRIPVTTSSVGGSHDLVCCVTIIGSSS